MVTVVRFWTTGDSNGRRNKVLVCDIVDATNGLSVGDETNLIPASAFGLTRIENCGNLVVRTTATGAVVAVYWAAPNTDGSAVVLSKITVTEHSGSYTATVGIGTVSIEATQTARIVLEGV